MNADPSPSTTAHAEAEERIADTLALCDQWAAMGTRSMNIGAVRRSLEGAVAHEATALGRAEARIEAATRALHPVEDQLLEARAEDPFTSTLPNDQGPDFPATEARIFPSVDGHDEPLDVLALLEPDHGLLVHVGGACLTADGARALVTHLTGILTAKQAVKG